MSLLASGEYIEIKGHAEPTARDIKEMAVWMGADPKKDRDLFWIAEQALKAPPPPHWKQYRRKDGKGDVFYYNSQTNESSWDHPQEGYFLDLMALEKKKKLSRREIEAIPTPDQPLAPTRSAKPIPASTSPRPPKPARRPSGESEKEELQRKLEAELDELRTAHRLRLDELRRKHEASADDLNKFIAQKQQQSAATKLEIREIKAEIEHWRATRDNARRQGHQLGQDTNQQEMEDLQATHLRRIDDERKKHNEAMVQLQQKQQAEIEQIKAQHARAVQVATDAEEPESAGPERLKASHQKVIGQLRKEQQNEVANMEAAHSRAVTKLKESHDASILELKAQQQTEINDLKTAHSQIVSELNAAHEKSLTQLRKQQQAEIQTAKQAFLLEKSAIDEQEKAASESITKLKRRLQREQASHECQLSELRSVFEDQKAQIEAELANLQKRADQDRRRIRDTAQLAELRASLEREKEELEAERRAAADEVRQLSKRRSEIEGERKRLDAEIEALRRRHLQEISEERRKQLHWLEKVKLSADEQQQISAMKSTFEAQKRQLIAQQESDMEDLKYRHECDRLRLEQEAARPIADAKAALEAKLQKPEPRFDLNNRAAILKRNYEQGEAGHGDIRADLDQEHDAELRAAQQRHDQAMQQLEEQPRSRCHRHRHRIWLSYIALPQISLPPTRQARGRTCLAVGNAVRFGTPWPPSFCFSLTSAFVANFAPRERAVAGVDEKLFQRLASAKIRLHQIQDQFDAHYSSTSIVMKGSLGDVRDLCRGYQELIDEQNRVIEQIVTDFQTQMSEATREFRTHITQLENVYRMAQPIVAMPQPVVGATMDPWGPVQTGRLKRSRKNRDHLDDGPGENDVEQQIRLWKRSWKRKA
jgi:hypothetical protein